MKGLADLSIRMLYEFYSTQTTKKPASIKATYLLDGVPKGPKEFGVNGHQQDGEDIHMQSSPYMSSSMPLQEEQEEAVPSRSITLAKEEDLEGKMGIRFVGLVYFAASELSVAEKAVSGQSKIQANTLHTYLQLGAKQGTGKPTKLCSRFRTMPIMIESPNSVRLQQSDIRGICE